MEDGLFEQLLRAAFANAISNANAPWAAAVLQQGRRSAAKPDYYRVVIEFYRVLSTNYRALSSVLEYYRVLWSNCRVLSSTIE